MQTQHLLDVDLVDAIDDSDGDDSLALVWCLRCERFEWHWINNAVLGTHRQLRRFTA